jgi:thioredoxin reductase (NADPH)
VPIPERVSGTAGRRTHCSYFQTEAQVANRQRSPGAPSTDISTNTIAHWPARAAVATIRAMAEDLERMFPRLTQPQIQRLTAHGRVRTTSPGEILVRAGEPVYSFFVVLAGQVEIVQQGPHGETLVVTHGPSQFTGEVNLLSGRRSLTQARVSEGGEVVEVDRARLVELVQRDTEISEILLRAFILRRVRLIARGLGDAVLLGSNHCAGTLRVREFLNRNAQPYAFVDLDSDEDVQELLDRFHVSEADVPVLICRGERVLRNPTDEQIAECLGLNQPIAADRVLDVIVVGAGPAGLSAAVYAASEGLDVLVIEARAPGGQAGSSSRIENYLGFPTGISGQDLAVRALGQANKFGAQLLIARRAARLDCRERPYTIYLGEEGSSVHARAIVIATGAEYRKPPLDKLSRFEGLGVYYAATFMEAQLCAGEEVIVIGGGNAAGQAAVFLAEHARRVHILVRSGGLAATMSRYLIRRIEDHPKIELHSCTELTDLVGEAHLASVTWRSRELGVAETRPIRHVFVMAGALPATGWIDGCLTLDENGFIKTGTDLSREDLTHAHWSLERAPYLLETSTPGVFAVGDVRSGNLKRVASAVGEGSIAVSLVHRVLAE